MEFADEIDLGNFSTADLDDFVAQDCIRERSHQRGSSLRGLRLSFAVSACTHVLLAWAIFYFIAGDVQPQEEIAATTLRVEFVPSNPLVVQADESSPESSVSSVDDAVQANSSIPLDEVVPKSLVAEQPPRESSVVEVAEVVALEATRASSNDRPKRETESISIPIPSAAAVQDAISSLRRSESSRFYDCNKIEEEKEFSNCLPADTRDYASATKNTVYDFYNPAIEISRSRQMVTTLAMQSASVSQALALNNLPSGLSAYVLEEIEQGIETYSNNSNRALDHINTLVDKSAAGAQARRVFDHWVVQQSAILQSRRVEIFTDAQLEEKCKSYEKFVMAPAEFTRCLYLEISTLGFSGEF